MFALYAITKKAPMFHLWLTGFVMISAWIHIPWKWPSSG
jgi:hypothetical protein